MSPLGISERYKVIFVCAARHVGLALARRLFRKEKIAFCFGCNDIEDIKLHILQYRRVLEINAMVPLKGG